MLSFNDIIGQEGVKAHLLGALNENKISHAYILSGEEGSGKMMLAERFAAALQCDGGPQRPCGCCINCMQSETRNHPDIIYVTHEKKSIVVDDIRNQLVNDITIKPYSGQYKVYIIDEAEKMNEAAQNALLKTLEEPPEYAVIMLLAANTGAFLQTILSRCVTLELKPIENSLIEKYLMERQQLPDYIARLCASFSCGCIGKAIRYASDESFGKTRDRVLSLVRNVRRMKQSEISEAVAELGDKENKAAIDDAFELMLLWYRDVLVYKATHNKNRIIFSEELSSISEDAEERSYENLNAVINTIDRTRERLGYNVSFETSMQLLINTMQKK